MSKKNLTYRMISCQKVCLITTKGVKEEYRNSTWEKVLFPGAEGECRMEALKACKRPLPTADLTGNEVTVSEYSYTACWWPVNSPEGAAGAGL